jgi:hypothetical protein
MLSLGYSGGDMVLIHVTANEGEAGTIGEGNASILSW